MYAIAFDLSINDLKEHYNPKYHSAYVEIKRILKAQGFEWIQGSVYVYTGPEGKGYLVKVYETLDQLRGIGWFRKSVRDLRIFRIEEWSNFTEYVKKNE